LRGFFTGFTYITAPEYFSLRHFNNSGPDPLFSTPLDNDNILGTYTLINVVYPRTFNGKQFPAYPFSYSGNMYIQADTLTLTATVNGETEIIDSSYTRAVTDSKNGHFYVNDPSGVLDISYSLRMWINGIGQVSPDQCGPSDCIPVLNTTLLTPPTCITRPMDPYNDPTFWE
jgi:hypothetical protein